MRKKIAVAALAGGLGLTGGMLIAPSIATAADSSSTTTVGGRLTALKDALKGLVTDGTLTQAQADKVATTLDQKLPRRGPDGPGGFGRHGGPGGPGHLHPDAVAKALGMTEAELRTQLEAGKTLTAIAQAKGISKSSLISSLVKAAEADIAADVKAGRLTQAQADQVKSGLQARITARVDQVGRGPRGDRPDGPPPGDDNDADDTTATPSGFTGASA
jgi:hypothetical protein